MAQPSRTSPPPDPVDELVEQLLECGAVLSQIVVHAARFRAAGAALPDTVPILDTTSLLIRDVLCELPRHHSWRDIRAAARIVEEVTDVISEEIFLVDREMFEAGLDFDEQPE